MLLYFAAPYNQTNPEANGGLPDSDPPFLVRFSRCSSWYSRIWAPFKPTIAGKGMIIADPTKVAALLRPLEQDVPKTELVPVVAPFGTAKTARNDHQQIRCLGSGTGKMNRRRLHGRWDHGVA